jgi:hypothetical protein
VPTNRRLCELQQALFSSAVVLLFHIWGGKRAGLSVDLSKGVEDVHICMELLRTLEDRYVFLICSNGPYLTLVEQLACSRAVLVKILSLV